MSRLDREAVRAASPIEAIVAELTGQPIHGGNGTELKFRCPFHEDAAPSLRVNTQKQNYYCDPCGSGGDVFEFVQRVRDRGFKDALAFLAARAGISDNRGGSEIVATYPYVEKDGTPQYETVRLAPKDFRQRRRNSNGDLIWNLKGVRPLLYRLDKIQGQKILVIVEGEKDVDRLWSIGVPATCNHGGAKKWKPAHVEQLIAAGCKTAIVLPDNDDAGQQHAEAIAPSCHDAGVKVKVLGLPDLPAKGDISNWLDAGHTRDQLAALVRATPVWAPSANTSAAAILLPKSAQSQPAESSEPPPVPDETIDLAVLLTDIVTFLRRFVIMSAHQAVAIALWVCHTHAIAAFDVTPYLDVKSATPRAGKTRLFEVLLLIVANGWFTSRVSAAALIRKIDAIAPTLLFDERDATFKGDPELAQTLRGILNAGYKRGGAVSLCVGIGAAITVKDFEAFCPKAIGGIGALPDTVQDRSIAIGLRRRIKHREPLEKFKLRFVRPQAALLLQRLTTWARAAVPILKDAEPVELELNNDRAEEVWSPLLTTAALAGADWPANAAAAAVALSGSHDAEDDSVGVQLLADIRQAFEAAGDPDALPSKEIRENLHAMENRPWSEWGRAKKPITGHGVAKLLREFEIVPAGNIWLQGKAAAAYRRASFEDAWARYLSTAPDPVIDSSVANSSNETGHEPVISIPKVGDSLTNAKPVVSPNETGPNYELRNKQPEDVDDAASEDREVFEL